MTRRRKLLLAGLGLVLVALVSPEAAFWVLVASPVLAALGKIGMKPGPKKKPLWLLGAAPLGLGVFIVTAGHPWGLLLMALGGGLLAGRSQTWWGGRTLPDDRALLALALADLLELGVPLPEAVDQLARDSSAPGVLRAALPGVLRALEAGSGLAGAVAGETAFPPSWPRCLAAAERTGSLPATLRRLAALEEDRPEPFTYVGTLLVLCGVVAVFTATYILPTFVALFEGMSLALPLPTRILIAVVKLTRDPLVGLGLLAGVVAGLVWRARLKQLAVRLPGVRGLYLLAQQRTALAVLQAALPSGMPLPEALDTAASALEPSPLRRALEEAARTGAPLGVLALNNPQLFSPRLGWLLAGGERQGQLGEALSVASGSLDVEFREALARGRTLIENGLVLLLGGVVGFLVVALMTPLYQLVVPLAEGLVP